MSAYQRNVLVGVVVLVEVLLSGLDNGRADGVGIKSCDFLGGLLLALAVALLVVVATVGAGAVSATTAIVVAGAAATQVDVNIAR